MLHGARLIHFVGKKEKITKSKYDHIEYIILYKLFISKNIKYFCIFLNKIMKLFLVAFLVANSTYIFVRVATLTIAMLVFLYGLSQMESVFDYAVGNFNIPIIRFTALSYIVIFQIYLSYIFISRQLKRARENVVPVQTTVKSKQKSKKKEGEQNLRNFFNMHLV